MRPRSLARLDSPQSALKAGDVITVESFKEGQYVDVIGITKGKGFQGVVRRFRVAGKWPCLSRLHVPPTHRLIGMCYMLVAWKNQAMPGHMGNERRTMQNLRVVKVLPEKNLLLVKGAIPGANGDDVSRFTAIKGQPR